MFAAFRPGEDSLVQLGELVLAFALSALVGLERELRHKSAGLRTNTLVGVSAALFMLISKHGFDNVILPGRVVLDPSRVAAQVVSGIGFIGGGVIFMRRDAVRGLTTAASVWLTAALGMACGAGLVLLALATALGHFVIMLGFPLLVRRFRPHRAHTDARLTLRYRDGDDTLRLILLRCTEQRFRVGQVTLLRDAGDAAGLSMRVTGRRPLSHLLAVLGAIDGLREVRTADEPDLD